MAAEGSSFDLIQVVSLLGAAVVAVPLFKRLGLGSVLGYLAAGLAIGPYGWPWSPTRTPSSTLPNSGW